jgi:hypothetical protein
MIYCSGCGRPMEAQLHACPACGRPVAQVPVAVRAYDRVHRHLQTIGVLWVVWAVWSILQWLIAATFLSGIFGMGRDWGWGRGPFGEGFPFMHIPWFVPFVTLVVILRSTLALATGVALLRRAPWARNLALVTAFLTLLKPITGTVLAIYTLWVLLPSYSAAEYEQMTV